MRYRACGWRVSDGRETKSEEVSPSSSLMPTGSRKKYVHESTSANLTHRSAVLASCSAPIHRARTVDIHGNVR